VEVPSIMIKDMIEKTIFSVSVDDLQYHLSSIYWERVEFEEGYLLRLISTDGHRLTLIERPLPATGDLPIEKGILIPRKGMAEVIRFLGEEDKVLLGLGKQSLALKADDRYLFIRLLLDKKFPEYRRIIPESFVFKFGLNRKLFTDAIRRISLLSTDRFKGVVFKLFPESIEVSFTNPEVGEGREIMPLFLEEGDASLLPMEVGFNARYFLEPLNLMKSDLVILELNDRERPCRLRDQGDPHYFSIIMPMSL
jgi:DNA polymerase-3 subunit beta